MLPFFKMVYATGLEPARPLRAPTTQAGVSAIPPRTFKLVLVERFELSRPLQAPVSETGMSAVPSHEHILFTTAPEVSSTRTQRQLLPFIFWS